MTERERLIRIIENSKVMERCGCHYNDVEKYINELTDYLLKNEVMVPPCKAGDMVYTLCFNEIDKSVVVSTEYSSALGFSYMSSNGRFPTLFRERNIGKTVFLTREEAEKALKERA